MKEDAPFKSNALTTKFIDSGTAYVDAAKVDNYIDAMRAETKSCSPTSIRPI